MSEDSDNKDRQAAELTLLTTMYPAEFSWRSSPPPNLEHPSSLSEPFFAVTLHPSYTLEMTLPSTYPSTSKPSVYLSCGGDVPTSQRKDARAVLAKIVAEQDTGDEILDLIISAFFDILPTFTAVSEASGTANDNDSERTPGTDEGGGQQQPKIKQVVIWSHHLLATSKRRDIQAWSKELSLAGYARPGHPGAVFAEGDEDQVDEFVRRLKALRWQALQVRAEDTVAARILGPGDGIVEVESLGEISEGLKERDPECAEMFLEGMKISGVAH